MPLIRFLRAAWKSIRTPKPGSRVASGVAAHLYSQVITVITQLAAVPLFLQRWNADSYGQWIAVSAVPAYLTIADVGIMTAAGNLMSMHNARGEHQQVKSVFKAGLSVVLMVVPTVSTLAGLLLYFFSFGLSPDQRRALFMLTLAALITIASGLFDAAYRSCGKYPKITFQLSSARLAEWTGMLIGLFVGGTLTSTALGNLTGRVIAFAVNFFLAQTDVPHVDWNLTGVDLSLARKLAKSGLGFISITLGSLLTLQGMVVLVATQLGGTAVAIFSTSRTLTRLLAQLAVVSGKSMAPEVSALYGSGAQAAADRLIKRMTRLVLSAIVAGALVLAPLGSTIMAVWSHGKIPFNPPVFFLLLAAAVATSCWQIQSVRLTATNQHQLFATLFVSASALVLLLTYLGLPRFGIDAAAAGTLLTDLLMIVATFAALRLTTWHRGKPS